MPTKKKPSPAQLAARAKFVAMVRAKSKAKKSATKKATVKKAAPKKAAKKKVATKKSSLHKDTKSHNVRINVVSGIDATNMSLRQIKINNESIDRLSKLLLKNKESVKYYPYNTTHYKNYFKQKNKEITNYVKMLKVQNTQLKKHIK